MIKNIPVSQPWLEIKETEYVLDALNKKAISGFFGEYINKFEEQFAQYSDCKYGVSTTSGTTALHLALITLGIKKGDEVIVSTFTNMATIFAILYQGAKPIPIDIEEDTLNIDPTLIECRITPKTKAILVVHLFGHPVDMDPVMEIACKHNLFVIEDCAEAHGAIYKGKKVGSFGDIGCFSFYANKIITTGEGGMLTLNNPFLAQKAHSLKSLAFGTDNKFMHDDIGYNYRMTNLQAALGCAQFEKIEKIIERKREIAKFYTKELIGVKGIQLPCEKKGVRNVYWMYHIVLKSNLEHSRTFITDALLKKGIETRDTFTPCNMQDIFIKKGWTSFNECPKANQVAASGFYFPSGPTLTDAELEYIIESFKTIVESIA
ncbi:MAG: putative pyridoxal phosphate-dependent aminotransferase EpsN [Syntrophorhabdus sp. PtaB.Bin027]|nr:MAG: putative pyridoxal phosphate-dependent aminotransferase EpsN [Syntrophorhabdus sp. PtaB.Bin027]